MPKSSKFGIIYRAYCEETGKSYIGLTTKTLNTRKIGHLVDAFKRDSQTHFHRALRKHGRNSFKWEELDFAENIEDLKAKEIYWIGKYDSYEKGYNSTLGGDWFPEDLIEKRNTVIKSEESRRKISESLKRKFEEDPTFREQHRAHSIKQSQDPVNRFLSSERMKKRIDEDPSLMKRMSDLANLPEAKEKRQNSMKKHLENKDSSYYKTLVSNGIKSMSDPEHCKKMWTNAKTPEAIEKMKASLREYNKRPEVAERKSKQAKEQMTEARKEALREARRNTILKKLNLILKKIDGEVTEEKFNSVRTKLKLKDPSYSWYLRNVIEG